MTKLSTGMNEGGRPPGQSASRMENALEADLAEQSRILERLEHVAAFKGPPPGAREREQSSPGRYRKALFCAGMGIVTIFGVLTVIMLYTPPVETSKEPVEGRIDEEIKEPEITGDEILPPKADVKFESLAKVGLRMNGIEPDLMSDLPENLAGLKLSDGEDLEGINNRITTDKLAKAPEVSWPVGNTSDTFYTMIMFSLPAKKLVSFRKFVYNEARHLGELDAVVKKFSARDDEDDDEDKDELEDANLRPYSKEDENKSLEELAAEAEQHKRDAEAKLRRKTSEQITIHWFVYNIPDDKVAEGQELVVYDPPEVGDDKEQTYVVLVFEQSNKSETPPAFFKPGEDLDEYIKTNDWKIWAGNVFKTGPPMMARGISEQAIKSIDDLPG